MTGRLQDRIAVITGASRGIGRAVALGMAAEGAHVILVARTVGGLEEVDDEIRKVGGKATLVPLDLTDFAAIDRLGATIFERWGKLDFILHSIAFAPMQDLHGRVIDCSRTGFMNAMDVSCHSFIRMAKLAEPLMEKAGGGSMQTVSYFGAEKVVEHYNIMGPVKAALESVTRYLAAELGPKGIRVNTLSPGPLATRAASGIDHFDDLMVKATERAPTHHLTTIEEGGSYSAFLATDAAKSVTGQLVYIDGGYNIIG